MPIKLPKGFQRRKSSGHALDDVHSSAGESSFRVLEKPTSKGKSFDGGVHLRSASTIGLPAPPQKDHHDRGEDDMFAMNRGSGGTERSQSTAPYDSAASSARLSTSSTNPSSIDARSDKNGQNTGGRPHNDLHLPHQGSGKPGFFRSPPRTFSFDVVKNGREPPAFPDSGLPRLEKTRNRTVTESTASTATPPKLFDSDLALENSELDGFGNMFDHIGSSSDPAPARLLHRETATPSPNMTYPPTSYPATSSLRVTRAPPPEPISVDRSQVVESSPYSWASQDSHDNLIRSPSPSKTITQGSPLSTNAKPAQPISQPTRFGSMSEVTTAIPHRKPVNQAIRTEDKDIYPPPLSPSKSKENKPPSADESREAIGLSPASEYSASFDPVMAENAQLADMYQETKEAPPKPASTTKVMTPAQWERYKQQKEMDRRLGALSDDSGSEPGDKSDDDDELERGRQAAKQRRKQEAHLAVYRQKMMKMTGEAAPPSRPESSLSALRLGTPSPGEINNRMSHMTLDSKQSGKSSGEDEDEDEDVPLGILAAHGFPNKNRPPTRLANSPSNSNLRGVSQSQGQAAPSVKGGSLPVFARQLPPDPYYGASLVNQSNREAFSLNSNNVPIGAGPATAHPIHPSGLVGVIAGEERARAARRGSPNPAGGYEMPPMPPHPGMVRSQTTGTLPALGYHQGMPPPMPGMPGMPGMPPMLTPGDQAQIQMAQQMTQMMQMQMQWMQQMSQTMGGQMPSQNMPPFPGPHNPMMPRPESMHMQHPPAPQASQRTMSTLNPSMAPWNSGPPLLPSININGSYAPSIAPSERSNIGLASRYRPVSIAPEPEVTHRRASTFSSASARPWNMDAGPRPPAHGAKQSTNTFGRRSPLAVQDDEDDEQGWAEMKMKKDKKQKSWALRRGQNALQELYNPAS